MYQAGRGAANRTVAARLAAGVGTAALVVVLAGCQSDSSGPGAGAPTGSSSSARSSAPALPAATIAVSPADLTADVPPNEPISVTATGGRLTSVVVTDPKGDPVPGVIDASGASWANTGALAATTTYTIEATAVNSAGAPTTSSTSFTTLTPTKVLGTKIAPLEDETVGVGMPIIIYFTAPVTDRAAVEKTLSVEESIPVEGGWHWYSNTEIHYRPAQYWPAGEQVTVNADVAGVDAGKGVWGDTDHVVHFKVGDSHIATVDAKTHVMTVTDNGTVVKTAQVSLGRDKYPTTSGIHVVLEKSPTVVMDSATVGIPKGSPDYYYETVLWDVRITWSGEFVHSAPWSVSDQGHVNVSHGCVNAAPAVAQWFYDFSRRGDIVSILNTPRRLESGNGWTDWNMSWADWLAGSALGAGSVPAAKPATATPQPPLDDAASASAVERTQAPPKVTGPPVVTSTAKPTPTPTKPTPTKPTPTPTVKPTPSPNPTASPAATR